MGVNRKEVVVGRDSIVCVCCFLNDINERAVAALCVKESPTADVHNAHEKTSLRSLTGDIHDVRGCGRVDRVCRLAGHCCLVLIARHTRQCVATTGRIGHFGSFHQPPANEQLVFYSDTIQFTNACKNYAVDNLR